MWPDGEELQALLQICFGQVGGVNHPSYMAGAIFARHMDAFLSSACLGPSWVSPGASSSRYRILEFTSLQVRTESFPIFPSCRNNKCVGCWAECDFPSGRQVSAGGSARMLPWLWVPGWWHCFLGAREHIPGWMMSWRGRSTSNQ